MKRELNDNIRKIVLAVIKCCIIRISLVGQPQPFNFLGKKKLWCSNLLQWLTKKYSFSKWHRKADCEYSHKNNFEDSNYDWLCKVRSLYLHILLSKSYIYKVMHFHWNEKLTSTEIQFYWTYIFKEFLRNFYFFICIE